jgi:hypothetical protein
MWSRVHEGRNLVYGVDRVVVRLKQHGVLYVLVRVQMEWLCSEIEGRILMSRWKVGVVMWCVAVLVYRVGVDAKNQLHSWWVFVLDCSHSVLERCSVECESRVCLDWEDRG